MVLINCYKESNLNKDVIHKGKYDINTKGICGIKNYWIDIIPELNEDNINSLYGGSLVLEYLLVKNNNDIYLALKDYKGSIKNTKPVDDVIKLYEKLK